MKNHRIYSSGIAMLILLLAFPLQGLHSQHIWSGTVEDSVGSIPGAQITARTSGRATDTNIDGTFAIDTGIGDVLVIRYPGMGTQEVLLRQDVRIVKVTLRESTTKQSIQSGCTSIRRVREPVQGTCSLRRATPLNTQTP